MASQKEFIAKKSTNGQKARSREASTARGVILAGAAIVASVNPAAGIVAAKVAAAAVGAIDIFTRETQNQQGGERYKAQNKRFKKTALNLSL